ncbi:alpha-2-macroglobulin receptor-associated protein-like [Branchiostoma floridae]|uniref:Alpha-2-macroglobulin receptor-associated protein-like n=1 Tax=Branchiostoma floridae TaxID=7739 RepID=A0A9J7MK27_BRAFL|nr:alpha-2-macroglobulin receptor-associated protein-like [Branchiostoma floridae]
MISSHFYVHLVLLVVCAQLCLTGAGKYSKEKNDFHPKEKRDREFRSAKVQAAWEKAQKLVSEAKLAELHSDLKLHEMEEFKWKKLKAEGGDQDGEKEANLRENLLKLMSKYGIDGGKYEQMRSRNDVEMNMRHAKDAAREFTDHRIKKIWMKAQKAGFSPEELEDLRTELKHHQEKVEEYQMMANEIPDYKENTIEGRDKNVELKQKFRELRDDLGKLDLKISSGYNDEMDFKEPKVKELWAAALRGNFTDDELKSIKEELSHFQKKMDKHSHYKQALVASQQQKEDVGKEQFPQEKQARHADLLDKVKDIGYKVKKHYKDLHYRINKELPIDEL